MYSLYSDACCCASLCSAKSRSVHDLERYSSMAVNGEYQPNIFKEVTYCKAIDSEFEECDQLSHNDYIVSNEFTQDSFYEPAFRRHGRTRKSAQTERKVLYDSTTNAINTSRYLLSSEHQSNLRRRPGKVAQVRGVINVNLRRIAGAALGLGLAGGSDRGYPPKISFLRPGSVAHRCDQLRLGDHLTKVNGIEVENLKHDEILTILKNSGSNVLLQIEYDLNESCFVQPCSTSHKCTDIVLKKEDCGFGLTLRGGAYGPDENKSRPIVVTNIRAGGPAQRESRLQIGDRILCINGIDVYSATLATAQKLLDDCHDKVTLTIEYDASVIENAHRQGGCFSVEIKKASGADLGVKLMIHDISNPNDLPRPVFIESIIPASAADRCSVLHPGDQIVSINGVKLNHLLLMNIRDMLKNESTSLRLEILPLGRANCMSNPRRLKPVVPKKEKQLANGYTRSRSPLRIRSECASPEIYKKETVRITKGKIQTPRRAISNERSAIKKFSSKIPNGEISSAVTNDLEISKKDESLKSTLGTFEAKNSAPIMLKSGQQINVASKHLSKSARIPSSMHGSITMPYNQPCHSETMEVSLSSYAKGAFGLMLHKNLKAEDSTVQPAFISYIEKGSPAEKCGVLQVGDRILSINDWCTADGTSDEANHILRKSSSPLALTVQFDVIEPIHPTDDLLNVKLAKRGNNLGIIVRSESEGKKGEPVIIADIRTGSVAQRCGSIQPGDRIIAVDNIPLDSCTVEEAMRLLQRSGDVVKLRIRKASALTDDYESTSTVVYSIELNRKGRPLGITIASRGESGDPIVISQLASQGLAERTGALKVGDRIIAINGESVEGRKVSDAMAILQQGTETVTIKISRDININQHISYVRLQTLNVNAGHRFPMLQSTVTSESISGESDKLGTPVQSIDSALESLDDSPNGQQRSNLVNRFSGDDQHAGTSYQQGYERRTKSCFDSTCSTTSFARNRGSCNVTGITWKDHHGWDSGLSSTTDNGLLDCCSCQKTSKNDADAEQWVKILEALETVGEAEMLKKLEDSIMTGNVPICGHLHSQPTSSVAPAGSLLSPKTPLINRQLDSSFTPSTTNTILRQPFLPLTTTSRISQGPQVSQSNISDQMDSLSLQSNESHNSLLGFEIPPSMPPPKPLRYDRPEQSRISSLFSQLNSPETSSPYMTSFATKAVDCTKQPSGISHFTQFGSRTFFEINSKGDIVKFEEPKGTIHRVTLHKDPSTNSFGFSVSDGTGDNPGVFVNAILPGGPADRSAQIQPLDRILQVNETSLQYLDCDLAVPLLNADRVDLVLFREPSSSKTTVIDDVSSCISNISLSLRDSLV